MNLEEPEKKDVAKPGYIEDFASGKFVRDTPEERQAVQPFAKRLTDVYGYPKGWIQTHPQFRIKESPSQKAAWPVDITVFQDGKRGYEDAHILVECKRENRKDGIDQLKMYLGHSSAQFGVWYNGKDIPAFIQKVVDKTGRVTYRELPGIPAHGQKASDIGLHARKELQTPPNLKQLFLQIRNHLAGMTVGITRDEALAQEMINILFCKIYDENYTGKNEIVKFRAGVDDQPHDVKARIEEIFTAVKRQYPNIFAKDAHLKLDAESLTYVVSALQLFEITKAQRDGIGEAFETFIGPALRGGEGQFFTPRNVVEMMISILDPDPGDSIVDPACGSGGFLVSALRMVSDKIERQADEKEWSAERQVNEKIQALAGFRGLEKDEFLTQVTRAHLALMSRTGVPDSIHCENSLRAAKEWTHEAQGRIKLDSFDIVVTNPPFGSKIVVKGKNILEQYRLGHAANGTQEMLPKQMPQLLFIERCLQLLHDGGRMAIVLPESIFGMPKYSYVVDFILERATIYGIVSMPEDLFQPFTHAKTCIIFLKKGPAKEDYGIFMANAKYCGHDSRGNDTIRRHSDGTWELLDDVPKIAERYRNLRVDPENTAQDHLGFVIPLSRIRRNIFIPKYYNPEIDRALKNLEHTHDLVVMGDLVKHGVVSLQTGIEPGKMEYGRGNVPFIRTSDLSNWELKIDPKQSLSDDLYEATKDKLDVRAEDIFVVRDGTYLVGTSCMITEDDTKIAYCGGLYKIRVDKKDDIDPYLLLALLNTPLVKAQIRAKQFTRDVIDTLGKRVNELILPVPKDTNARERIAYETREIVETRARLRKKARELVHAVAAISEPAVEEEGDQVAV